MRKRWSRLQIATFFYISASTLNREIELLASTLLSLSPGSVYELLCEAVHEKEIELSDTTNEITAAR